MLLRGVLRASPRLVKKRFSTSAMTTSQPTLLMTPSALTAALDKEKSNVRVIDATWFMPNLDPPRSGAREFQAGDRLQGVAGFFDLDSVAAPHALGLKHMLPTSQHFAEACGALGIKREDKVVVYDTHGIFSAPRAVFTFKAFGHPEAYVLDGGLPRWKAEGLPTESGDFRQPHEACKYTGADLDEGTIRSYDDIIANTEKSQEAADLVLDARPHGRFTGDAPEPRAGLSSGHMPHSVSLPFTSLLSAPSATDPSYKTLLPRDELRQVLLRALGNDEAKLEDVLQGKKQVVNSCGSGMTAGVIWLALSELGVKSAIYDESWTGYSMRKESKILKGE